MCVRIEGARLCAQGCDGTTLGVLDPAYQLGRWYDLAIRVAGGFVEARHNAVLRARAVTARDGCYFKAGCYAQSSAANREPVGAHAQTQIAAGSLRVLHDTAAGQGP